LHVVGNQTSTVFPEQVLVLPKLCGGSNSDDSDRRQPSGPSEDDVAPIEAAAADALVSVRRGALAAAARLLAEYPGSAAAAGAWVRGVLPLARDPEAAVADAVLEQVASLVAAPLAAMAASPAAAATAAALPDGSPTSSGASANANDSRSVGAAPQLLAALAVAGRGAAACLGRALAAGTAKKGGLMPSTRKLAAGLEALLRALHQAALAGGPGAVEAKEHGAAALRSKWLTWAVQVARGAWAALRELAALDPAAPDWQFLADAWAALRTGSVRAAVDPPLEWNDGSGSMAPASRDCSSILAAAASGSLLWVISHAATRFPSSDAGRLAADLTAALLDFSLPPDAAASHIAALHRLQTGVLASGHRPPHGKGQWSKQLLAASDEVLAQALDRSSGGGGGCDTATASRAAAALFMVGELALALREKPPSGLMIKVQSMTAAGAVDRRQPQPKSEHNDLGGNGGSVSLSQYLPLIDQTLFISQQQPVISATQLEVSLAGLPPGSAQALAGTAWLAWAKVCLVDEGIAKKAVPLFVAVSRV
jgi:condensin-2 complex subunit D3